MPKLKTTRAKKPRKTRGKRKSSSSLWPYILFGLIAIAAVWYITKPENIITQAVKKAEPKKQTETPTPAQTQEQGQSQPDLDPVIISALEEMGISQGIYKRSKRGNTITFQAPVNDNSYDLNYANMVLKGRVEKAGGIFKTAKDSERRQTLEFSYPNSDVAWKVEFYYDSKPYAQKTTKKTLAIVVDDFGEIGGSLLDGFLNLPREITFAIMPEFKNSVTTMERAHAQGRESIIHVPMEPIGYPQVNPGKNAILVQMKPAEISKLLNRLIDQMPLCIGINNHMGSLATADSDVMTTVMSVLKARDKIFLDSRTSNVSVAYQEAQKAHINAFRNGIFLDSPDISDATMEAKLKQLETMSEKSPHIIAITHCHNQNKLSYLIKFIDRAYKLGYTLVPLSRSGRFDVPGLI